MYRSFPNLTVKATLKSVNFDKVTEKNNLAPFYGPQVCNNLICIAMSSVKHCLV